MKQRRPIALIVGCALGTLVLVLAAVLVPDQVREVSVPPATIPLVDPISVDESMTESTPPPETPTGEPIKTGREQADAVTQTAIASALRPFSDLDAVPEELRDAAVRLNEASDTLTNRMVDMVRKDVTPQAFAGHYMALQDLYYEAHRELYREACRELAGWEGLEQAIRTNNADWYKAVRRALVQESVEAGRWDAAGVAAYNLSLHSEGEDAGRWHEHALYYWRRAGWQGRAMIAVDSLLAPVTSRGPVADQPRDPDGFLR